MSYIIKQRSDLVREAERRNKREQRNETAVIAIISVVILLAYIAAWVFGGVQ